MPPVSPRRPFPRSIAAQVALAAALLIVPSASAVEIEWVSVGDPGNAADPGVGNMTCGPTFDQPCGAVAYSYRIGKYEVTNAEYAEFLDLVARTSDPYELYNPLMGTDAQAGGIARAGSEGSYGYGAIAGFEDMPVAHVSFADAMRFVNWLHNGQGLGNTENGAYTLLGGTPVPSNATFVTRNAEATVFLASEAEWYKAAYYDPDLKGYYDYPTGADAAPTCESPPGGANSANCAGSGTKDTGAYDGSWSPVGTFDQGGNVAEWTDKDVGQSRGTPGGHWLNANADALRASAMSVQGVAGELARLGFRVATVPEPDAWLLCTTALLAVASLRRIRRP
jgi:formylglycine-generating enzyme required for sulfatase activity